MLYQKSEKMSIHTSQGTVMLLISLDKAVNWKNLSS